MDKMKLTPFHCFSPCPNLKNIPFSLFFSFEYGTGKCGAQFPRGNKMTCRSMTTETVILLNSFNPNVAFFPGEVIYCTFHVFDYKKLPVVVTEKDSSILSILQFYCAGCQS